MKAKSILYALAFGATLGCAPAWAHHSFAAEFDSKAPIEFTGTVTKVEWANPHTYFYVDVTEPDGKIDNWALELGSPNVLMRRGWTRNSLKIGDSVTVTGWRAKDGSLKGNARSVVLSSGQKLFAGSSNGGEKDDKGN
jgi:Family of unknown function (DUF6152)